MTGSARTLAATSALLLVTMIASFTPTPLYPRYREEWDLAPGAISVAFAAYPVGVMVVLLLFGGLSDRWGRAPALRLGAVVLLGAMATLAAAPAIQVLVAGRALQGMGTALITSAGAATLMELHPGGPAAGSQRNALALSLGIAVGPLLAAQAAAVLPLPLAAPYVVVGLLVLLPFGALLPRVSRLSPVPGGSLVRPTRVPRDIVRPFTLAAAAIAGTNATFALLGSFGADLMAAVGHPSGVAAGLFVTGVLLVITTVQLLGRRLPARPAMVAATGFMSAGWAVGALGAGRGAVALVLVGGLLVGTGAGLGLLASTSYVGAISPVHRRAEIYAAYLFVAFAALATSALAVGHVVLTRSVATAAWGVAAANLLLAGYQAVAGRVDESV